MHSSDLQNIALVSLEAAAGLGCSYGVLRTSSILSLASDFTIAGDLALNSARIAVAERWHGFEFLSR
jgi:hypothetical protein